MKLAALLLSMLVVVFSQQNPGTEGAPAPSAPPGGEREGNYEIRFEPSAKLQTGVEVPFSISVKDALHKPLQDGKVILQIETGDHTHVKVFRASAISPGAYVAKPVFPIPGQWNVYVEVRRDNQVSARTLEFSVAE